MEKLKVLMVDDDALILRLLRHEVQAWNDGSFDISYYSAKDGGFAKSIFLKQRPDIVITDVMMPTMNGFELTIFLKTSEPAPYVIAMSGAEEHLQVADSLGSDFVVNKPKLIEQLPNALNAFLEHRKQQLVTVSY